MRITVIYDNEVYKIGLKADWGFSCLVEVYGKSILFDTGAKGSLLLDNMKKLNIDPMQISEIFISHAHWDHTGGLRDLLELNPVDVYVPSSYPISRITGKEIRIKDPVQIHENIFSTGELQHTEQSLVVRTEKGSIIIAGCSHPGVGSILAAASRFGKIRALIGGLHGFRDFDLVWDLEFICPAHCTRFKKKIKSLYPEKYVGGGAGKVIEL